MGFDKVDLFDVEIEVFESQLQQIALPLFEATDQNLTNWLKKVDDDFRAAIAEAKDEVDRGMPEAKPRIERQTWTSSASYLGPRVWDLWRRQLKNAYQPWRDISMLVIRRVGTTWGVVGCNGGKMNSE